MVTVGGGQCDQASKYAGSAKKLRIADSTTLPGRAREDVILETRRLI